MRAAQGRSFSGEFPTIATQAPSGLRAAFAWLTFATVLLAGASAAVAASAAGARALGAQDAPSDVQLASAIAPEPYTAEELDNLLAPVALYPDPILAQVLVAATFPEQVELAARYVRVNGAAGVDQQPWDISVRALSHYAPVLNLLADRIDWTTALGQAHATQPADVMESVQSLRRMARAQGNLVTTAQQEVVVEDRNIYIVPAQPRVIYVPTYDPLVIYHRPVVHVGVYRSGWHFGAAFPIGVWLNYDFDWHRRHVYYHGWHDFRHHHHRHWYARSRPHITINTIYINTRHTTVVINRRVVDRRVHFDRFDRYNTVHRRVSWDRRRQWEDRRQVNGQVNRQVSRRDDGPSWDRDGSRGGNDRADRGRAVPRRVAEQQPSRPVGTDRPSWDRRGRTDGYRQPGAAPRTQPQRTSTPGTRPQRAQPQRAQPQRTQTQRSMPQRQATPRSAPQRATPQRATPQRATPQRTATPQRATPQRTAAPRPTPQRSTPRAAPSRQSGGSAKPQRGGGSGRAVVAREGNGRRAN